MWATTVLLKVCAQDFWKGKTQLCGKYKPSMSTSRGYLIQKKIRLAGHWFTLDPNITSRQLPLHFGDVIVSPNGMFWKSFSVLLFMLTFWIIKLSTLKSALLWASVRIDKTTSRGPFQLRVFSEFKIQRFTSGDAYSAKTCFKPDSNHALPFVTLFY